MFMKVIKRPICSCNFILVPHYNCDLSPPQGGQHDLVVLIKNPIFVLSYDHPCIL